MSINLQQQTTTSQTPAAVMVNLTVNGVQHEVTVDVRTLLVHLLRDILDLTGTNIGCLSGHCGACSILMDGQVVKSCTILAASADGATITTVEGLAQGDEATEHGEQERLSPVQSAFWAEYGFQCGYCTPGMMLAATALLNENPNPTDDDIRRAIAGNLCRCTGYQNIIKAVRAVRTPRVVQPVEP